MTTSMSSFGHIMWSQDMRLQRLRHGMLSARSFQNMCNRTCLRYVAEVHTAWALEVRFSRCVQLNPGMRNTSMCIHTHLQCIWILFVNICTLKYMHICRSMSTYRYLLVYTLHTRSCEPNYKEKPAMRLSDDVNSGVCRWLEDISVFCRNVHFFVIRGYPFIDT